MRRAVNSHGNNLVRSVCLSAAVAATPLIEPSLASAQPSPVATVPVGVRVNGPNGSQITLNNSNGNPVRVYAYSRNIAQQVVVDGPNTLTLRLYPSITVDSNRPNRRFAFSYTIDGTPAEVSDLLTNANSGFSNPTIPRGSEIGSPVEVRIPTTTLGSHTIVPLGPSGFFEVVSATAPAPVPAVVPQPLVLVQVPVLTGPNTGTLGSILTFNVSSCDGCTVRVRDPSNNSCDLTPDGSNQVRIRLSAPGQYSLSMLQGGTTVGTPLVVSATAPVQNTAPFVLPTPRFTADVRAHGILARNDIPFSFATSADLQYRFRLRNPRISLNAGLYGGSDMTGLNAPTRSTSILLPWVSGIGGVSYDFNSENRLTVFGFVGWQRGIFSADRTISQDQVFAGGRVLYDGRYVRALVEGSNNSFNPVQLEAGYRIRRSLVPGVYPVISLGAMLLANPASPSSNIVNLSGVSSAFIYASGILPLTKGFSLGADLGLTVPTVAPGFGARLMFNY